MRFTVHGFAWHRLPGTQYLIPAALDPFYSFFNFLIYLLWQTLTQSVLW